jgi:hypothetical protein
MSNTWGSLGSDQLIPVNKCVKDKEQSEKGLEEEEEEEKNARKLPLAVAFVLRTFEIPQTADSSSTAAASFMVTKSSLTSHPAALPGLQLNILQLSIESHCSRHASGVSAGIRIR